LYVGSIRFAHRLSSLSKESTQGARHWFEHPGTYSIHIAAALLYSNISEEIKEIHINPRALYTYASIYCMTYHIIVCCIEGRRTGIEGGQTGIEGRRTGIEGRLTGTEGRRTGTEGRRTGIEGRWTGIEGRRTGIEGRWTGIKGMQAKGY
jgi:hypothetical protein